MDLALSDVQALTLVVTCAVLAVLAIAIPPRWSVLAAAAAEVGFIAWTRSSSGGFASAALLGLALCVGSIVRLRRARAVETESALLEAVAASDARREAAVLEERAFLAREIHDVLAHSLSALAIQLERVRLEVARLPGGDHAAAELAHAHRLASHGMEDARGAISALRGERTVDFDDMRKLVDEFGASTGIPTTLEHQLVEIELPTRVGLLLYRALQEALTNAVRHGRPSRVDATIETEAGRVTIRVVNDGADGASVGNPDSGFGLQGLRERVALAGGSTEAGEKDGGRFEVLVCLPL